MSDDVLNVYRDPQGREWVAIEDYNALRDALEPCALDEMVRDYTAEDPTFPQQMEQKGRHHD